MPIIGIAHAQLKNVLEMLNLGSLRLSTSYIEPPGNVEIVTRNRFRLSVLVLIVSRMVTHWRLGEGWRGGTSCWV